MATQARLRVMFACVGNSARSQMAEGFARALGGDRVEAMSGGSSPKGYVLPEAAQVMRERGVDISAARSKAIDEDFVRRADLVVTMGCGEDACPAFIGKKMVDWELPDPDGKDLDAFREVRDEVERRVRDLLARHGVLKPGARGS